MDTLIITNEQVKRVMTLDKAIKCVEKTWKWHGEGLVVMPPKITTDMSCLGVDGWFNSMPSYLHPLSSAGLKFVGGFINNPKIGLPFIKSNILIIDPWTGMLRALVAGDWISDARTGAQPAVAMKYLAASTEVITIIGAGNQAHYAMGCILRSHKVKEARICDLNETARNTFGDAFPDAACKFMPYASNEEACRGADVIITLTTANSPLVKAAWCKEGCLVLTMGSYTETSDDVATDFNKIYLDCTAQGLHRGNFKEMAERGVVTAEMVEAELPEIIAGKKPGRTDPKDRIICELVGMGSPDLCIATEVYNIYKENSKDILSVDMMA